MSCESRFCVDKIAVYNSCNNFLATFGYFYDHFLASFGEQFGYKNCPAPSNPARGSRFGPL